MAFNERQFDVDYETHIFFEINHYFIQLNYINLDFRYDLSENTKIYIIYIQNINEFLENI